MNKLFLFNLIFILSVTYSISSVNSIEPDQKSILKHKYCGLFKRTSATQRKKSSPKVQQIIHDDDLSEIAKLCSPTSFFYSFHPGCRQAMIKIRQLLKPITDVNLLLDVALALRQSSKIHPHLWFYATSTVFLTNPELEFIPKMKPQDGLPDLFFPAQALKLARESASNRAKGKDCIVVDETFTQGKNSEENKLWYFRESLGINTHHWYWHSLYALANQTSNPDLAENRRGELFYFMHAQLMARYHAERLSNGLPRAVPLEPKHLMELPSYYSNLVDDNSGANWTSRPEGATWKDVNFLHYGWVRVTDNLTAPLGRLREGIKNGNFQYANGTQVPIRNFRGIDIIGNAVESSGYSINPHVYGNLHNLGHITIGLTMDPTNTQPPGVMCDTSGAMRDIIFYRWHNMIQEVFDTHKKSLPAHQPTGGDFPLLWNGVVANSIKVKIFDEGISGLIDDRLETNWRSRKVKLTKGLDLAKLPESSHPTKSLAVCMKELDHKPFKYQIEVTNNQKSAMPATVRIYIAPKYDEHGKPYTMSVQRELFFALDIFEAKLEPGKNAITRQSNDNHLTIPYYETISTLNKLDDDKHRIYCGCGWPSNMLIPKGTKEGMAFDLFLMLTNAEEDKVIQDNPHVSACVVKPIMCGEANKKYPDSKPMFYPFDTIPYQKNGKPVEYVKDFVEGIPNMYTKEIKVFFKDYVVDA